ncbi:MAG TPA: FAD-binding and (Fe-S)-binding domain-containing protein [Reyranella sp.]|nr:FAD-binding and (Fe-S)-binding domain-containing protein [Reyranella sp.]
MEQRNNAGRVTAAYEPVPEQTRLAVERDLRARLKGEVRFDSGSRALYATDASNYRQVPVGVVVPRDIDDVVATVELCNKHDVPVLPRGGGTSLSGETCNVAVVIDFSKYLDQVRRIDPEHRLAEVEPGCVLDKLRDAAEQHHLTFGPDPATHDHNTLGGMIGNNSCGEHSVMAGRTSDNVHALDIVTYDGLRMTVGETSDAQFKKIIAAGGRKAQIYRDLDALRRRYGDLIRAKYPRIPRLVSGYENLDALLPENGFNVAQALVGTEATCVTVLGATLRLVPSPKKRVLALLSFDDICKAADVVPQVLEFKPIALEAIDHKLVEFIREKHVHPEDLSVLPAGHSWLVAEFGGDTVDEAAAAAQKLVDGFKGSEHSKVVREKPQQKKIWELREAALAATAHVPGQPETWPGWEDSAVPRAALGRYLRELLALFDKHGYHPSVYGHFGDGLVHCRVGFDLRTEAGLANWQRFLDEASDLVVGYGGSLSGEHGDGQARAALIHKMYGPELMEAFHQFKRIWDPKGRMNPGKVIDPYPITSNLRVGPQYQPPEVDHYFAYAEDSGSFTLATRRCVGVGSCRRTDSDKSVMCPSYMATHEEKHSTRGRARMLFEMLHGGAITDGWRSAEVEEALDLCLACKGCKSDCPVQVDMATYKAEFRAHHYAGRLRPRSSYSMGLIHRWSRIAGAVPWLANLLTQTPGSSSLAKWIADIAPQRRIPRYSRRSFTAWFRSRGAQPSRGKKVLLWPDTFNNYFRAPTAIAAVKLLERLGYQVEIPRGHVCCGRPLYDWGRLDAARRLLHRNLDVLQEHLQAGTPIVGLEPACVSALRDELPSLLQGDERAARLSRSATFLTEFLDREQELPGKGRITSHVLVQVHCHEHAVLDERAERRVLDKLGIDYEVLASGCCGMAGAFGLEKTKYAVSMAAAERVLLPRVRAEPAGTILLANGFSCREQIEQGSGRPTMHMADVIAGVL